MNARRTDLDTAKGLGMVLVIVGHTQPPQDLVTLIYGLHMPLFFFVSGMLWNGETRIGRTARSLLRPFWWASFISWGLWMLKQGVHPSGEVPWWGPLVVTAWGGDLNGWFVHNTPLWFLPAMFSLLATLALMRRWMGHTQTLAVITLVAAALMFLPPAAKTHQWPMSLAQGLVGSIFFSLGFFCRPTLDGASPVVGAGALGAAAALSYWNGPVDLFSMNLQQPLLYVAAGFTGAWGVVRLSAIQPLQLAALQVMGRRSLWILAVHMPVLWTLRGMARAARVPEAWWLLTATCVGLMWSLAAWRDRSVNHTPTSFQRNG